MLPNQPRKPTKEEMMEAVTYMNRVKEALEEEEEKYLRFIDIIGNYSGGGISIEVVIARVTELFDDRPELILGFNNFLPKEGEIVITDDNRNPIDELEQGVHSFLNKLKERFQDDDHVYESFRDVLNVYMREHKDITKFQHEVGALLECHPDLLEEFTRISSDYAAISSTRTLSEKEADFMLLTSILRDFDEGHMK